MEFWTSLSLFMARLLMGGMFFISGKGKLKDPEGFAKKNELPLLLGKTVPLVEIPCGVALIAGIFPRLASLLIMGLMAGTMYKHIFKWNSPYWAQKGGWEYDLTWFILAFVILTGGPGNFKIISLF